MKNNFKKIAWEMFANGLRARDCGTWDILKKYDTLIAEQIVEELARVEVLYLMSQS